MNKLEEMAKKTIETWYQYQPKDKLFIETFYDTKTEEIFVDVRFEGEVHIYPKNVIKIFQLEPNWFNNQFDLEEEFWDDPKLLERIRELRNEGHSELEIFENIIKNPIQYLTDWIIGNLVHSFAERGKPLCWECFLEEAMT